MRHSISKGKSWRRRLLMLGAGCVIAAQGFALDKGSDAPAFALSGVDGPVKLAGYRGKLVYLDFWASWCGPCRQSFPWMNQMQAKYGSQGLQIIGVNLDEKNDDARSFLVTTPARFIIAFDPTGATPRNYGVKGMPSSLLVDVDGKVILEHIGFNVADQAELENKIRLALKRIQ